MKVTILSIGLLGSQNLFAMDQPNKKPVDPIPFVAGIFLCGVHYVAKKTGQAHSVTFSDEVDEFCFPKDDSKSNEDTKSSEEETTIREASPEDPIGIRIAAERNIPLIELEIANNFVDCILGLQKLINVEQTLVGRSLPSGALDEVTRLTFSGVNLHTILNTIENMIEKQIRNGQYYDLFFHLAYNYPEPILSSTLLDNMEHQSDSDLLATLLVEDDSMLTILVRFYQQLAQCQATTGVKLQSLKGDLCVALNQGKIGSGDFYKKIDRIVRVLLN